MLTPYQYTYVNFSYPVFNKTVDKFELDYWDIIQRTCEKFKKNIQLKKSVNLSLQMLWWSRNIIILS